MIVRDPKFLGFYVGTRPDPITNRAISNHCWNQHHEGQLQEDRPQCKKHKCECPCHDHDPFVKRKVDQLAAQ